MTPLTVSVTRLSVGLISAPLKARGTGTFSRELRWATSQQDDARLAISPGK